MSTSRTVLKNIGVLSLAEGLTYALSFVLVVAISRYLGAAGLGKYSFAFAFVGLFAAISDFGLNTFSVRSVSRNRKKAQKYFSNYLGMRIIISIVTFLIPVLIIFSTEQPNDVKLTVFFASLAMAFNYLSYPFRFLFNAFERFEFQSIALITERAVALAIGLYLLFNGFGIIALAVSIAISNFVALIVNIMFAVKNFVKFQFSFDFKFWKYLFISSLPFGLVLVFRFINFRIDTIMLTFMQSYTITGIYNAAYKIIDALIVIPATIVVALFPAMSKLFRESRNALQAVFEKVFFYLFVLALPICVGITLLADRIILFVYKEQFLDSVIALQILVWTLIFLFLNYFMGYLLNSIDKQKSFTLVVFAAAIVNVSLNFILIPIYSYKGSSAATVITEFFSFALLFYFSRKNNYKVNLFTIAWKPIVAVAAMTIFLLMFRSLHILVLIPLCALIYFTVLFLVKAIGKEEMGLARNLFRKE